MVKEKKFVKNCQIGELSFSIGLNRSMAVDAITNCKGYWEAFSQSETMKDAIAKAQSKDGKVKELDFDKLSYNQVADLIQLENKMSKHIAEIVDRLLPQMLEYAGTVLPVDVANSYNRYAQVIIETCEEYGVLENYYDEDDEPVEGFYQKTFNFILQAFTNGGERKKSAMKIIMN